jgi:hypothetical protein
VAVCGLEATSLPFSVETGIFLSPMLIWFESLKERDHSEDLGIDGRIILRMILRKYSLRFWIGFIWLKIMTGGGLL